VEEEHQCFLGEKRNEGKKGKNTDIPIFRIGFGKEKYPIVTPLAETYKNNWKFFGS
jgi:hypothetical protein